jgi:hypothetical protein
MKGKLLSDQVEVVSLEKENGTLLLKVEGSSGNTARFRVKAPLEKGVYNLNDRGLVLLVLPDAQQNIEEVKKLITDSLKIK